MMFFLKIFFVNNKTTLTFLGYELYSINVKLLLLYIVLSVPNNSYEVSNSRDHNF